MKCGYGAFIMNLLQAELLRAGLLQVEPLQAELSQIELLQVEPLQAELPRV